MSLAAAREGSVSRLIYIADIPRPAEFPGEDLGWIDADPHVVVHRDNMLSEVDRKWAEERLEDVRVIDTNHFVIFRHPELVARLVLEARGRIT